MNSSLPIAFKFTRLSNAKKVMGSLEPSEFHHVLLIEAALKLLQTSPPPMMWTLQQIVKFLFDTVFISPPARCATRITRKLVHTVLGLNIIMWRISSKLTA